MNEIIELKPGDKFIVTGYYYLTNKKFRFVYANWHLANSINLWRGHVWLLRDGKRKLLKKVWN